jgi:hypothetical protein
MVTSTSVRLVVGYPVIHVQLSDIRVFGYCRISAYFDTVGYSDIRILSEKEPKELFKLN